MRARATATFNTHFLWFTTVDIHLRSLHFIDRRSIFSSKDIFWRTNQGGKTLSGRNSETLMRWLERRMKTSTEFAFPSPCKVHILISISICQHCQTMRVDPVHVSEYGTLVAGFSLLMHTFRVDISPVVG